MCRGFAAHEKTHILWGEFTVKILNLVQKPPPKLGCHRGFIMKKVVIPGEDDLPSTPYGLISAKKSKKWSNLREGKHVLYKKKWQIISRFFPNHIFLKTKNNYSKSVEKKRIILFCKHKILTEIVSISFFIASKIHFNLSVGLYNWALTLFLRR